LSKGGNFPPSPFLSTPEVLEGSVDANSGFEYLSHRAFVHPGMAD